MATRHEHLIDLKADFNWALHRHDACRPNFDTCPVTIAVRKADSFPHHRPGTYACGIGTDDEIELRPVAPRLTERQEAVEQFRTALLTGLEDLDRDDHWGTLVRPADVEDLIARVVLEVTHG